MPLTVRAGGRADHGTQADHQKAGLGAARATSYRAHTPGTAARTVSTETYAHRP
ncbi:hypothetical protein [Streptomyces kaniharaensis]|uniref:hypothetical protein n=1 Tax=Streptomyces kaniharaensis TaxID=212423 RepID=UPI00129799DB|nr:hypothetical protein [Streptomyces kaniharaensis]